jgi:hypothetical protein
LSSEALQEGADWVQVGEVVTASEVLTDVAGAEVADLE